MTFCTHTHTRAHSCTILRETATNPPDANVKATTFRSLLRQRFFALSLSPSQFDRRLSALRCVALSLSDATSDALTLSAEIGAKRVDRLRVKPQSSHSQSVCCAVWLCVLASVRASILPTYTLSVYIFFLLLKSSVLFRPCALVCVCSPHIHNNVEFHNTRVFVTRARHGSTSHPTSYRASLCSGRKTPTH